MKSKDANITKRNKQGFTIIEVVLVLAVAGLIFAMVFVALPAMNRLQRNTQRRRDLSTIQAAFLEWRKHNSVSITDSYTNRNKANGFCTFYKKYLVDLQDPSVGEPYKVALYGSTKVVNCKANKVYERGGYDPDVHGSIGGQDDNWALMDIGDIQFDDTAFCSEEGAFDDAVEKRIGKHYNSGTNLFAIRMRLEGGESICVDGSY